MTFQVGFKNFKDYSKRGLWLPEFMLKVIFMWPKQNAENRNLFYACSMFSVVFVLWGGVSYLYRYFKDYNQTINSISVLSPFFQTLFKLSILQYHSVSLGKIIEDITVKFWPCDLFPDHAGASKRRYRRELSLMLVLLSTGFSFGIGLCLFPLLSTDRELPYRSIYPFDCLKSPIYEFLYVLQCLVCVYLINNSVLSFDFMFINICNNLVTQYILLKKCFTVYGDDEKVKLLNKKFKKFLNLPRCAYETKDENKLFLVRLIQHHQLLTRTTKNTENVVNIIAALQLCMSIVAICLSGFMSTNADIGRMELLSMGIFLTGHVIQLILYCSAGNELFYESSNLTDNIFGSKWYKIEDTGLNKDIIIVMKNARNPAKITAGKVFPLDYSTCFEVLRLTFSFYTLLSTLINK